MEEFYPKPQSARAVSLTPVMGFIRLSPDAVYRRSDLMAADGPDGSPGILAVVRRPPETPDGEPVVSTRFHSVDDILASGASNVLATSDDPLYLIAPGDVIEVCVPSPTDPALPPRRERYNAHYSPEDGESQPSVHLNLQRFWSDPSSSLSLPKGSYASAVYLPPSPSDPSSLGPTLFHRDSPDSPWELGPRPPRTVPSRSSQPDALRSRKLP